MGKNCIKLYGDGITITDNKKLPYLIIQPSTHDKWLDQRSLGIGASECGKTIGCSKYGTALSLFMDKVFGNKVEENWAMKQGHIFERVVAEEFQSQTGYGVIGISSVGTVKADWLACSRDHSFLRVSPDYLYWLKDENGKDLPHNLTNRGILECKTSVKHYTPEDLKGECLSWYCQVQYQLHVLGLKQAYLGFMCVDSLTGGETWFEPISYNEKFCTGTLIPAIVELWTKHISPAKEALMYGNKDLALSFAPEPTTADDVTLRYNKETEGKSINSDDIPDFYDKISIYLQNRVTIKELEKQQSEIEEYLKLNMKDAESIVGADGKSYVTFKAPKPSMKFNATKFKADCPDQYEQYCEEKEGARRFVIK